MKNIISKIPKHIKFIFTSYMLGILIFTIYRIIFFSINIGNIENEINKTSLVLGGFLMGFRFDTVISGYILALPLLVLSILSFIKSNNKVIYRIIFYYLFALYTIAFTIVSIDIPYFTQFFKRITTIIFNYFSDFSFIATMVVQNPAYWIYIGLYILVLFVFYSFLRIILRYILETDDKTKGYNKAIFSVLVLIIMFIGIRGRVAEKSPIRVGTAYFSNNAFINQMGLNPVFTFLRSYLDDLKPENKKLNLIDEQDAIRNVRKYLNIKVNNFDSPIARSIISDTMSLKANVILVLMESMSANKMRRYGNKQNLTPFLDSLTEKSLAFDKAYSAGIHTYNGIYSTLFGFPSIQKKHPLKGSAMQEFCGLPNVLNSNGYSTIYFTSHDEQFDNIGGFLKANGVQKIISQKDYPSEKVLSTLGVPDHYMFEYSIDVINKMNEEGKPFFAAYLTASDHIPYIIPDGIDFKPDENLEIDKQIIQYSDWSISHFIEIASKQTWFNNTIFVFTADHGSIINPVYDMALSYHHEPLIFYAPHIFSKSKQFNNFASQIDIGPTILGLLKINYVNNTLGIDLLSEKRDYVFFSADDKIACLNDDFYYIYRNKKDQAIYKYTQKDEKNYLNNYKNIAFEMSNYVFSMLQTTQYMTDKQLVKCINNKVK